MKSETTFRCLCAAILITCASLGYSQTQVALAPPLHPQYLDSSGKVLAGGYLFTYQAGTTTPQNTYIDSTGTTQNPDPILLDATGAPSNGSSQTGIWLGNLSYKFCAYSVTMVQQWCVDNVSGYLGLLNLPNTWSFPQTFSSTITDTLTDNQIVLGAVGNQTTLDAPPPTGNVTLHLPSIPDTLVGRSTTDTLTNKTLPSPVITTPSIGGCVIQNGPATYDCIDNANPTGTKLSALVKLVNSPVQATISSTVDTSGMIGICVAGCTNTGTATIQASGLVNCIFDAATTAGDVVINSVTVPGDCHDAGAATLNNVQTLGRVLTTNVGGGSFPMMYQNGNGVNTVTSLLTKDGIISNLVFKVVAGTVALAGGTGTVTLTNGAIFAQTPFCWGVDQTANASVKVIATSVSSISFTGTGTDVITYFCIPPPGAF